MAPLNDERCTKTAEGSQASGTSKKTELKLTNVARSSLEELRLDYEDFLRQRGLPLWPADHPALGRFKARRCSKLTEVVAWVQNELARTSTNSHGQSRTRNTQDGQCPSVSVSGRQRRSFASAELAANGTLSLLNLCCYLLERQLAAQAAAFEQEGGFTERLFRIRSERRKGSR